MLQWRLSSKLVNLANIANFLGLDQALNNEIPHLLEWYTHQNSEQNSLCQNAVTVL